MTDKYDDSGLPDVNTDRRAFMKKFAATAFITPIIASFAIDGIANASTTERHHHHHGNQTYGNQHYGNQHYGNQHYGNQHHHRHHQHHGNQGFGEGGPFTGGWQGPSEWWL
jgi:hypothetical protein